MLRPGLSLLVIVALGASVVVPAARADEEPNLMQIEIARETYKAGSDAYQKGDYVTAEKDFREVYDTLHSPSLLYDLALSLEKQMRWRAAADTYEAYAHDAPHIKDKRRLDKHVAELRRRAVRQEELAAVTRPTVREQGAPQEHGNEVFHYAEGEDRLMGFGEASSKETAAPAPQAEAKRSRWWIWVVAGGAVVLGAGVAVTVALTARSASPEPTSNPDFGPGAALVRF